MVKVKTGTVRRLTCVQYEVNQEESEQDKVFNDESLHHLDDTRRQRK